MHGFIVYYCCIVSLYRGTAVYTSSWVAPKADVHSQQRFFYMGQKGELNVDQAHRGYTVAKDGDGFRSVNPLFMKYTPTDGEKSSQVESSQNLEMRLAAAVKQRGEKT